MGEENTRRGIKAVTMLIDAADLLKTALSRTSFAFTGIIDQGSVFITGIPLMDNLGAGMTVVHPALHPTTKIVDVYGDYLEIDIPAVADWSGPIYAGFGLDICFRDIEAHNSVTLPRWKHLDVVECIDQQFPMIELLSTGVDTNYLTVDAPSITSNDGWDIDVTISHIGNDVEAVRTWILSCRKAIKEFLRMDCTLGETCRVARLRSARLSEMYQIKGERNFLQILTQTVSVFTDEL